MYTLTCKMCGKEFTSKGANAYYCPDCKVERRKVVKREYYERLYATQGKGNFKPPSSDSMQRLYDISTYDVNYHKAKDKWEEDKRDRKPKRKN